MIVLSTPDGLEIALAPDRRLIQEHIDSHSANIAPNLSTMVRPHISSTSNK